MAQALPSFVELLATLDLESDKSQEVQHYARYPTSPSFFSSSSSSSSLPSSGPSSQTSPRRFLTSPGPTSSFPAGSPSIIISHPSPVEDPTHSRRRSTSNRYNPYVTVPQDVFARRRSLPGDLDHAHDIQKKHSFTRSSSSSPPLRRASLASSHSEHGARSGIVLGQADQPISGLMRRRHPYGSPQSPKIPKAVRRSMSPPNNLTPVSLPSLPPLPPISAGTDSPAPTYHNSSRLPPISALNRRSTSPPGDEFNLPSSDATSPSKLRGASVDLGITSISHRRRAAHKHHQSSPC